MSDAEQIHTLYNAVPESPMVMTCNEASSPSFNPKSAGTCHLGTQTVPLPVSLNSMGDSEMLNVDVLEPSPRFTAKYVHGWWNSMTSEPPSSGHSVRLLLEAVVVSMLPPRWVSHGNQPDRNGGRKLGYRMSMFSSVWHIQGNEYCEAGGRNESPRHVG